MQDGQRRRALLAEMEKQNWAALVCFAPEDVLLASGYWPVMAASIAVFGRDGAVQIVLPNDELELAKKTSSDAELIAYEPVTLERLSTIPEALEEPLSGLGKRLGIGSGRVGVLLDATAQTESYQSTNHFHGAIEPLLRKAWPGVSVADSAALLKQAKAIKTAEEIARMTQLCKLARTGFDAAQEAIRAGRREDEIAAEINRAYAEVALDGFERGCGYFFCMSGPNAAKASGAYARTRQRVVEDGDTVMIHTNTVGDGLWSDITRTYVAGKESDRESRMRAAIEEARTAALQMIRPGVRARAVDGAAREVLERHGFGKEFKHGLGHGVGFAAADALARPSLHPKSEDVLEAGMTFNVEPAIYFDGQCGMRHCDVVVCAEGGARVLTDF